MQWSFMPVLENVTMFLADVPAGMMSIASSVPQLRRLALHEEGNRTYVPDTVLRALEQCCPYLVSIRLGRCELQEFQGPLPAPKLFVRLQQLQVANAFSPLMVPFSAVPRLYALRNPRQLSALLPPLLRKLSCVLSTGEEYYAEEVAMLHTYLQTGPPLRNLTIDPDMLGVEAEDVIQEVASLYGAAFKCCCEIRFVSLRASVLLALGVRQQLPVPSIRSVTLQMRSGDDAIGQALVKLFPNLEFLQLFPRPGGGHSTQRMSLTPVIKAVTGRLSQLSALRVGGPNDAGRRGAVDCVLQMRRRQMYVATGVYK